MYKRYDEDRTHLFKELNSYGYTLMALARLLNYSETSIFMYFHGYRKMPEKVKEMVDKMIINERKKHGKQHRTSV